MIWSIDSDQVNILNKRIQVQSNILNGTCEASVLARHSESIRLVSFLRQKEFFYGTKYHMKLSVTQYKVPCHIKIWREPHFEYMAATFKIHGGLF